MGRENEILDTLSFLDSLPLSDKKKIHFYSMTNIVFHLIKNPKINKRKNTSLQEIGEVRIKSLLLEYLKLIRDTMPKSDEQVLENYENYISPVGEFMMKYYRFSNFAGVSMITYFLMVFFVSTALGFAISLFFQDNFIIHISIIAISIIFALLRILIKIRTKRIFGYRF